jgi:hypothetical protein
LLSGRPVFQQTTNLLHGLGRPLQMATANGDFYIVSISLRNDGKSSSIIDSSLFQLRSGDTSYDADVSATMDANMSNGSNNSFFLQKLNPGVQMNGNLVFEAPPNLKGYTLHISAGFAGFDSQEVKLG